MYRGDHPVAHGANTGRAGHEKGAATPDRPWQFPTMIGTSPFKEIGEDRKYNQHQHHNDAKRDEFKGHGATNNWAIDQFWPGKAAVAHARAASMLVKVVLA